MIKTLNAYANNVYSQYGEDGIVDEILHRIQKHTQTDKWCVEFGAWDGVHLSNTYNLIKNKSYNAVLIEGDIKRHQDLCRNIPSDKVIKLCEFVYFEGASSLDAILKKTPIPSNFDYLSIDIDGCDYHIFESVVHYRPKIICIEYNPTIPNEVEFIQQKSFKVKHGSSAKSLVNLAKEKGYSPVASTRVNLFFVRDDLITFVIGDERLTLESVRDDSEFKAYLFSGYDGTLFSNVEHITMPWHRMLLRSDAIQQLPKWLRVFYDDYTLLQKAAFKVYVSSFWSGRFKPWR